VLTSGPGSVPDFEISQLAAFRVRRERRQPVPVDVIKPQLRTRVGPFTTDDDPHPGRPIVEVEDSGELSNVGAVTGFTAGVIGRLPRAQIRQLAVEVSRGGWQHPPNPVRQAALGEEVQAVLGATGGMSADEHLLARTCFSAG